MLNEIDLSRADLNLLGLFEVVLEELHVGRAAERLNLSSSAVSHGLGRLRLLLNDPLFLKTPKGVVPTERALILAETINDILTNARRLIANAQPFDPATSRRRFVIGTQDAATNELLPSLLAEIGRVAPMVDIGLRTVLPNQLSWGDAFKDLDNRAIDVAILFFNNLPNFAGAPARFVTQPLYDEVFVVAMRSGHPYADDPTLERYCSMHHIISSTGDSIGYVDLLLAEKGLSRRVALTVPNFMTALGVVAETNLLSALPKRLAMRYAEMFKLTLKEMPIEQQASKMHAVVPKVALMDAGIVWLMDVIQTTTGRGASTL